MVASEDWKKKIRIFYKGLTRQNKIGITIAAIIFILGLIFIPLLNSDRIWKKYGNNYSVTVPQNVLIGNKYEVVVSNTFTFHGEEQRGSITFTHIKSGINYTLSYYMFSISPYVETLYERETFIMLPGNYDININVITGGGCSYELFEMGIIPHGVDWLIYLIVIISSFVIVIKVYSNYRETKKRRERIRAKREAEKEKEKERLNDNTSI